MASINAIYLALDKFYIYDDLATLAVLLYCVNIDKQALTTIALSMVLRCPC